jgi:hypothetical protein
MSRTFNEPLTANTRPASTSPLVKLFALEIWSSLPIVSSVWVFSMKEISQVPYLWEWLTTGHRHCIPFSRTPPTRVTQPLAKGEAPTSPSLKNAMWWHQLFPPRPHYHRRALWRIWWLRQSHYGLPHRSQTPGSLLSNSKPIRRKNKCEPALDRSTPSVGLRNSDARSPMSERPSKPS